MANLSDILGGFTREELSAMVDWLDAPVRYSAPKKVMVSELTAYLSESPLHWMGLLPENDLRLLKKLVDAGPDKRVLLLRSDYPSSDYARKL